ncbi:8223_t:CDS:2 [Funneliformis mosseae]|uniref:8223_t:CDS:1 n=1 Tax=Funneliformis mosseae TaxID=27381 RepID=A0A9N8VGZ0_FUNMO|nr:8223_t:CDS:2 [Funneliformis mosseae]
MGLDDKGLHPSLAIFTNPSQYPTAITGQIRFNSISQNKTNVSGKLDSGIFDPEAAYYHFKIIDRSKNLLYDLTADGLTEWSVEVPGTTSFKHDFDKLPIDKIVEQFLEVSHSKKGTIGMTMIKPI